MNFEVMRLCPAQLLDINPADVLDGGLYRKCNTYKGGGGYDQFPAIYERRFGPTPDLNNQFVVQLKGCPLRCPYCYVTKEGVSHGESVKVSSSELSAAFARSGCSVFHLMGGAPALHLRKWPDLLAHLHGEVFHSDFLLLEGEYDLGLLREIAQYKNSLYAVSIKGSSQAEFRANTGVELNEPLLRRNMEILAKSGISTYYTFTGMPPESVQAFKEEYGSLVSFEDAFVIDLVHYKALDYQNPAAADSRV